MRRVPEPLYALILDISIQMLTAIEEGNTEAQQDSMNRLRGIYEEQCRAGHPDPFVTETLADFTANPREAEYLYRLAIAQCRHFPGEPIHTKQIGLASRLIDGGDHVQASRLLESAMLKAWAAKDKDAIAEIREMLAGLSAG